MRALRPLRILLIVGASLLAVQTFSAQTAQPSPAPRSSDQMMTYDEANRRVLIFGGTGQETSYGDLWSWDGRTWKLLSASGPSPRNSGVMVYDARRKRAVLFGGRVGKKEEIKGDTWEWNHKAWQHVADGSPRDHPAMAFDAARGRTVLFGGGKYPRPSPWATDTWEWDGQQWLQVATEGPMGRVTAMIYDSKCKQIVLFGGVGEASSRGQSQPHFNDTWIWNGKQWRKAANEGPPARARHAMAFDRRAGVVLLYGGSVDGSRELFGDMWQWDGERWTEIKLTGPTPGKRALHVMAYDSARGRTVLYGGTGEKVLDDTWEWDGSNWKRVN